MEWISPLEQSFMEKGWQKGLKKGQRQGLEQGHKEGALALLERQLIRRFGALLKAVRSTLASASLAQLHVWSDALFDAKSLQ